MCINTYLKDSCKKKILYGHQMTCRLDEQQLRKIAKDKSKHEMFTMHIQ